MEPARMPLGLASPSRRNSLDFGMKSSFRDADGQPMRSPMVKKSPAPAPSPSILLSGARRVLVPGAKPPATPPSRPSLAGVGGGMGSGPRRVGGIGSGALRVLSRPSMAAAEESPPAARESEGLAVEAGDPLALGTPNSIFRSGSRRAAPEAGGAYEDDDDRIDLPEPEDDAFDDDDDEVDPQLFASMMQPPMEPGSPERAVRASPRAELMSSGARRVAISRTAAEQAEAEAKDEVHGCVVRLEPVKAKACHRRELGDIGARVLTPVRRSVRPAGTTPAGEAASLGAAAVAPSPARSTKAAAEASTTALLESVDYVYVPNVALEPQLEAGALLTGVEAEEEAEEEAPPEPVTLEEEVTLEEPPAVESPRPAARAPRKRKVADAAPIAPRRSARVRK